MDLADFERRLRALPGVTTSVTGFESGATWVDVRKADRLWVVMINVDGGIGMDEVRDEDGFGTSCKYGFSSLAETLSKLEELLASA